MPLSATVPRLSYTRVGPLGAAPLVLVNGLGGVQAAFAHQLRHYGATRDVLVYDHRGLGDSEPGPPGPAMVDYAGDLARLLDELEIGRVDLVGLSFGGRVAMELALGWPERVGRLALVGTSAGGAVHVPSSPEVGAAMRRLDDLREEDWMEVIAPALFGRTYRERHPERIVALARWRGRHPPPPAGIRQQWAAFDRWDAVGRVGQLRLPCLVVHGDDDRVSPIENGRWLAAHLPDARLVVLEGVGHSPNVEDPARFHAALDAFFAGAPAGG